MTVLTISVQCCCILIKPTLDKQLFYWCVFYLLPQILNSGTISVFKHHSYVQPSQVWNNIPFKSTCSYWTNLLPQENKSSIILWMHLQKLLYLHRPRHSTNICSHCLLRLHMQDRYTIEWHSFPEQRAPLDRLLWHTFSGPLAEKLRTNRHTDILHWCNSCNWSK